MKTNLVLAHIRLVRAHQHHRALNPLLILKRHRSAKKHLVAFGLQRGIHHLAMLQPAPQKPSPPVNLTQPLLAIKIIPILRPIAVPCRPRHNLHDPRPFHLHQLAQFLGHRSCTLRGQIHPLRRRRVFVFILISRHRP
jgi:hypothetical protein